jgi:hypothetical protein
MRSSEYRVARRAGGIVRLLVDRAREAHEGLTFGGFFVALIFYRLKSIVVQEIEGLVFEGQLIVDDGLIDFDPLEDRAIGIGGQAVAPDLKTRPLFGTSSCDRR